MDATDAMGVATCHFMQAGNQSPQPHYRGWKDFCEQKQGPTKRERTLNNKEITKNTLDYEENRIYDGGDADIRHQLARTRNIQGGEAHSGRAQKHLQNDTTKNLESRKIACFKYDAIYYLIDKAAVEPTFTEYELGLQADAMIEFVNYFRGSSQGYGQG